MQRVKLGGGRGWLVVVVAARQDIVNAGCTVGEVDVVESCKRRTTAERHAALTGR